jgi:hypothetical protein
MAERLDIMNAVYGVKVVDTHEHLMRESDRLKMRQIRCMFSFLTTSHQT